MLTHQIANCRMRIADCGFAKHTFTPVEWMISMSRIKAVPQLTSKSPSSLFQIGTSQSTLWPRFAIALAFVAMLLVSWRRWTSPIADSGREMDLPLRLMNGEMLYRDAHYIYPPFSPYFNSFLYRIFGAHLD